MELWIIWLIVIVVLLIIEVMTQMMWSLCLGVGFLLAIVGALCGLSVVWQIVMAAIGSVAAYILLVPLFQKWHMLSVDKKGRAARTGMDALLGRKAILSEEITPERPGRGRIDGDSWQMRAADGDISIPRGSEVTVIGYDSIILLVRPINV